MSGSDEAAINAVSWRDEDVNKSFDEPDELVTQPLLTVQVVLLGEVYVACMVHQPGWSWSEHVQPVAATSTCLHHHQGVVLSGQVEIEMDDGACRICARARRSTSRRVTCRESWANEPYVCIEFAGVRQRNRQRRESASSPRFSSRTSSARRTWPCGSATPRGRSFARYGDGVRRARPLSGAGGDDDGRRFPGLLRRGGACRSVRWRDQDRAADEGLPIRARPLGQVERHAGNVRGVAVHAVTRIIARAAGRGAGLRAGCELARGSDVRLEDAGEHELKGLPGRRRVYRFTDHVVSERCGGNLAGSEWRESRSAGVSRRRLAALTGRWCAANGPKMSSV